MCTVGWEYSLPESVGHVGGVWDVELNVTNGPVIWRGGGQQHWRVCEYSGCVFVEFIPSYLYYYYSL